MISLVGAFWGERYGIDIRVLTRMTKMELTQNYKSLELEYSSWTLTTNVWKDPNLFRNRDPVPNILFEL